MPGTPLILSSSGYLPENMLIVRALMVTMVLAECQLVAAQTNKGKTTNIDICSINKLCLIVDAVGLI